MDVHVHILLITWCSWAPHKNNHHHCTTSIHGTSAYLLSPPEITPEILFLSHLAGFHSGFNAASSALLLPKPDSVLFHGSLKVPSCIIASVDHADYSRYLSAVKALHLLPAPYKSISSKACLCRSPGSFPSDDECATFFIETGKAGVSVQCVRFATAVQRWGKNKWAANLAK